MGNKRNKIIVVLVMFLVVGIVCWGVGIVIAVEAAKAADRAIAKAKIDMVGEVKRGLAEDFDAMISDAIKRQEELRNSIASDLAQTQTAIMELNDETTAEITKITTLKFTQHIDAICASDSKVVVYSVALATLHDYLAGGESTLDEVAEVMNEGLPINDRDVYGQYSRVCGITPEGNWYLQSFVTQ